MIPNHYYWYFKNALSPSMCNKIIKLGLSKEKKQALTYAVNTTLNIPRNIKQEPLTKEEEQNLFKKRKSQVSWLTARWLYKLIHPFVKMANENAGWNFEWDWSENMQFSHYKKGYFYGWHNDSSPIPLDDPSNPQSHGKIRKLSTVISLSNPASYQGGQFQMDYRAEDPDEGDRQIHNVSELNEQGTLLCFPSFIWHRLQQLTKGKRYSLIVWHWGLPFK